jgi:hypothetical protein
MAIETFIYNLIEPYFNRIYALVTRKNQLASRTFHRI